MTQNVNARYRQAAVEFARRVVASLGKQIDSIVLYGSVARGEATGDSDIDVLIVSPDPKSVRGRVSELRLDFDCETEFEYFITLAHYKRDEFLSQTGFPFIQEVLQDGVILHDDGIFSRLREKAARVSR
jgi:predicted nucleotidyltransferase